MLNSIMDQERLKRHFAAGISEDSDYTSDVGYPASAHHPNSSASQFGAQQLARGGASLAGGSGGLQQQQQGPLYADSGGYGAADYYAEPLYYNSRPPHHQLRSARDVEPPPRFVTSRFYACLLFRVR
ncbi:hypothetical protein IscW_ISCW008944 [Ixodes scapularis]|uniref:Uncharacterized protein n=1 Tax=Ixodes scapularis TaxID=6945 RepID=B7PX79_IXOSC|nr:hypothetical protein IscW_ISCW008944 [Ixodes scapularis]|eukprot:XP_002399521.1 hypothetical protein IscW_ISCW008944 [Ixodes scapularis]